MPIAQSYFYLNLNKTVRFVAFAFAALSLSASTLSAQDDLNVHGIVSDAITSSKIEGVKVTVKKDGASHDSFTTRANGKYEFYLDCGSSYEFVFEKDGFVKRSLQVDSRNVPGEIIGAGIIMPTDMSMFAITPAMKDADLSVFNQPIGKASYDPALADLVWDFIYTNKVKTEIIAFMRDVEKRQKELDKEASAAGKEEAAKQAKFDQFVKDGDAAVTKENYEGAVNNYQQAIALIPGNAAVETKLANAQTKLTAQKAAQEKDAKYNEALDAADSFMRAEDFDQAIEKYTIASGIKPLEKYPKDQLAEANRIKKDREANMAKQQQFNTLITKADELVAKEDFKGAIAPYQDALKIFPDNKEALRKLEEARNAVKRAEEIAALQQTFDALIAKADADFNKESYELALAAYSDAAKLIPENTYASERVIETQARIKAKADAAANKQAFDAAMKKGNDAMVKTEYVNAEKAFATAVELIPSDQTAKAKLEEARRLGGEKEAEAEKLALYDATVSAADALFEADKLPEAKASYEEARTILADKTYPLDQITKINNLLAQRADAEATEKAFTDAMTAGNAGMEGENFNQAVSQFTIAVGLKPKNADAAAALAKAEARKKEFDSNQAVNSQYQAFIDDADTQMVADNLAEAKTNYIAALGVKKGEKYPQDQLELIELTLQEREREAAVKADQAAQDAEFLALVAEGDARRAASVFDEAIKKYEAALIIKPDNAPTQTKLTHTQKQYDDALASADLDGQFAQVLAEADKAFKAKQWSSARDSYTAALALKSLEPYPQKQIGLIDEQIATEAADAAEAEAQARAARIVALLLEGDQLVNANTFEKGIAKYSEALDMDPSRSDIQAKIDSANAALQAMLESEANNEAYADAIKTADKAFGKEDWESAKSEYEFALSLRSTEQYPKDQIAKIDNTIIQISEAEALAERLKKEGALNKLIEQGDGLFAKNKFDEAQMVYSEALALVPESEIAQERLDKVQAELDKLNAGREAKDQYEAVIKAADQLFDNQSLEMAKLKYADAQEILPSEKYPAKRIDEIDLMLEKNRLNELAQSQNETDRAYRDAIGIADDMLSKLAYDDAIASYLEASEIKPDELYPLSQIERIELLIKEKETAELERERMAAAKLEAERNRKEQTEVQSRVNTDSERQAEQFMREAREAQERERYERIKKEKAANQAMVEALTDASEQSRSDADRSLDYYRLSGADQFKEAIDRVEARRKATVQNKANVQQDQMMSGETNQIRRRERYGEVLLQSEMHQDMNAARSQEQLERIARERALYDRQLEAMRNVQKRDGTESSEAYANATTSEADRKAYSRRVNAQRSENAKDIESQKAELMQTVRERATSRDEDLRATAQENAKGAESAQTRQREKSQGRVADNAAEINRQREIYSNALADNQKLAADRRETFRKKYGELHVGEPRAYTDYYRTELADHYPQGVTEESSTLGNKVIISRIVVKGNRGDEYKKVVDKAGNYYFKNGRSISEFTWNSETIQDFKRKKD